MAKLPNPCYRRIQPSKHLTILELAKQGLPQASIANALCVSQATVSRHLHLNMVGPVESPRRRPESEEFDDLVETAHQRQMIHNMKWASNSVICDYLQISQRRLQKLFKLEDVRKRVAIIKPFLNAGHMKARRAWALEHRPWTFDDWKKIIWSDESSICLGKLAGRQYVLRSPDGK